MSKAPEPPEDERQHQSPDLRPQHSAPREESALPVSAAVPANTGKANNFQRGTAISVLVGTLVFTVIMSGVLEYAGWQYAFKKMPVPHTPIPPLAFLGGVWNTTLGAVGVGAAAVVGALLFPSTRRNPWRRVPAAFAVGAGAFIAFLSFVTFGFFR